MDELKKRKVDEAQMDSNSVEDLRSFLDPLAKPLLVDLLAKLGSQYPFIAEEIISVASADPALRKLFVRGLAWNTTSETLCAAFKEHGDIEEGAVICDKLTGISRGYGFITYKDLESAQRALKAPMKMINGRMAVCSFAFKGLSSSTAATDQANRKIYIGGLSPDTTSDMLLNFFSRHGEIEEGSVAYNNDTNTSRGFGFVTYKTVEGAKKALDDPQRFLGGRNLIVKLADNQKSKVAQVQVAATPVVPGYAQAQKAPPVSVGYSYPQARAGYTNSSPPGAAPPYSGQPQFPYPQYPLTRDPQITPEPDGLGGYPYYMTRQ